MVSELVTDVTIAPGEIDVPKPAGDDRRFYSVTTILNVLNRPGFMWWSAELAAKCAVDIAQSLPQRIAEEGEEAVVTYIRDAFNRAPKGKLSAADLGTAVHDACERYALDGVRPEVADEVVPYLDRFDEWCQKWQPIYIAAEAAVFNPRYGYAGTLDAIAIVDGVRLVIDYKSSRKSFDSRGKPTKPWPESALQLAAYRNAELLATWRARRYEYRSRRYYLLGPTEKEVAVPVPEVDGAAVLHVTPEHANLHPVRTDARVFECFLFAIEAFRWQNEVAKTVIGEPVRR